MATRTSYANGTPSWIDLATPDPAQAKAFYEKLFGWSFTDEAAGDQGFYSMASLAGESVAGVFQLSADMAEAGMPPMWNSYVTVDDLEGTVAKVGAAGGAVMQEPMDVMDAGRMAVIADPAGAVICLWQPKEHIGAGLVNEAGTLCWNELISSDMDASTTFYGEVLGWGAETADMPTGTQYTSFTVAGESIAGGMAPPMEGIPSNWGIYFAVDDVDATLALASANGATTYLEPMTVPGVGIMAGLVDPTGAMFSIIKMDQPAD